MNKTFYSSTIIRPAYFRFISPSTIINCQNPNFFLSYLANYASCQLPHWIKNLNIQLLFFYINSMEFETDLSRSMMHAFGYFCISYRKRFSIYSNFTFLHNFNGPDLCFAKRISTISKVWLLISFICLRFPIFFWIICIL